MLRFTKWTVYTIILMVLLQGLLRGVGGASSPPIASQDLMKIQECLSEVCFHGLIQGQLSLNQVREAILANDALLLDEDNDLNLCWYMRNYSSWKICVKKPFDSRETIGAIFLTLSKNEMRLGDAIVLLGTPLKSHMCLTPNMRNPQPSILSSVIFSQNIQVFITDNASFPASRYSPQMDVWLITLEKQNSPQEWSPWNGFVSVNNIFPCKFS